MRNILDAFAKTIDDVFTNLKEYRRRRMNAQNRFDRFDQILRKLLHEVDGSIETIFQTILKSFDDIGTDLLETIDKLLKRRPNTLSKSRKCI